jgi:hypothetical protein
MKPSTHRHTKRAIRSQRWLLAAMHAQRKEPPVLFSERDDDAAEYASLMRDFECVRDEALDAERYN